MTTEQQQHEGGRKVSLWGIILIVLIPFTSCVMCNYNDNQTAMHCIEAGGEPTSGGCFVNTTERCYMPNVDRRR